jgi:hypothetical protein
MWPGNCWTLGVKYVQIEGKIIKFLTREVLELAP